MFALLLGAAAIYLVLGDLKEAVVLGIFACTSVLIAVVQEARTERVLESLRDLTSPRALVIRDGIEKRIAGTEVVRGDLVILAEGDRVPADATVLSAHDLQCDESLLTGEAVPVRKIVSPGAPPARPGGDDLPYVYSGSLVVRGHGRPRSPRPARTARSARSAWRSRASIPSRHGCACRHGASFAILPSSVSASARWPSCCMVSGAAAGSMRC